MENMDKAGRPHEFGLDLLRIIAMVMAFILHFYYENGFYYQPVSSAAMFFHAVIRDIAFCCVPLFLVITGYLKCGREWEKGYYRSLGSVLISWLLISLLCGTFQVVFEHQEWTLYDWFTRLAGFEMPSYSWYINMYFGVFLLSPFINLLWNKLETRENRQKLLAAVMLLTFCATTWNSVIRTLPDFWTGLWPFAYYLIGCYIKTYRPSLRMRWGIPLAISTAGLCIGLNIVTGGRTSFTEGYHYTYGNMLCVILTVLVFCTLYQINSNVERVRIAAAKFAPLSLNMILVSRVFNTLLFPQRYTNYGPGAYFFEGLWRIGLSLAASWCIAKPVYAFSHWVSGYFSSLRDQEKQVIRIRQAAVWFSFFGAFIFLLWKCRCGFGNSDEAFYLTIPIRLCQGDALITEEWHVSQLSSLLLYPIMWVYRLIFGTSQYGIVLHFRYIYVLIQFGASTFLYTRWKKLSEWGALAAALVFFLFAPYGIGALSYNSMGILCVTLALTILVTADKNSRWQEVISGILFAGAVLCCPALVIVYLLYGFAVFISKTRLLNKTAIGECLSSSGRFLRITIGCAVTAAAFGIFVLSRASGTQIVQAISNILNDSAHLMGGWQSKLWYSVRYALVGTERQTFCFVLFILLFVWAALDRKRMQRRWIYWLLGCGIVSGHMVWTLQSVPLINAVTVSVSLLPLLSVLLVRNEKISRIFWGVWFPGVLYSLCIALISNQSFYALETGLIVSCAGSILIVILTVQIILNDACEKWWMWIRKFLLLAGSVVLIGGMLGSEAWRRYYNVFWDVNITEQTEVILDGPEAGIYVTKEKKEKYEAVQMELQRIKEQEIQVESAAILTEQCWYFLFNDWKYGLYSAWLSIGHVDVMEQLKRYYDLNPNKQPDLILIDHEVSLEWQELAEEMGYSIGEDSQFFQVLHR